MQSDLFPHINKGIPKEDSISSFLAVRSTFSAVDSEFIIYLFF